MLEQEELFWWQKSRISWWVEREDNTKFFHAHATITRRRNKIVRLKDEKDEWTDDQEELKMLARRFFMHLYMKESIVPCNISFCSFPTLDTTAITV